MIFWVLATSFLGGLLSANEPAPVSLPRAVIDLSNRVGMGSCLSRHGPIELRNALFLENRALEFMGSRGLLRVELEGQVARISSRETSGDETISRTDIGELVDDHGSASDVGVKLALLDGRVVIYWRETFQNRIYRQGLLRIEGLALTPLCQGRAGTEISH